MEKMFLQDVASGCDVAYVDELVGRSVKSIVNDYILERMVCPYCQRNGKCISSQFMEFMAEYGKYLISLDRSYGELLMELAMQRISRGALPHAEYDLLAALPERFWNYSTVADEREPLDEAGVDFLQNNLGFCVEHLNNKTWRYHAEIIKESVLIRATGRAHLLSGAYAKLVDVAKSLVN